MPLTHDVEELLEPEPRERKLTPWIQEKLSGMRARLREMEALRVENERLRYLMAGKRAAAEGAGSDAWVDDATDALVPLGKGTTVMFGQEQEFEVRYDAARQCLEITGNRDLALYPENSFQVRVTIADGAIPRTQ